MKRSGFTLIELLVVIAIIAILAAILFPVFAQAREKARQITCTSNEKQIGLGILMYVQDYDETFPYNDYIVDGGPEVPWYQAVGPYIKNGNKYSDGLYNGLGGMWSCPDLPVPQPASYGVNNELCPDGHNVGNGTPQTLAVLQTPADTVLVAEKGLNDGYAGWEKFNAYQPLWTDKPGGGGAYPSYCTTANASNNYTYPANQHADVNGVSGDGGDCDEIGAQGVTGTTTPNWGSDYHGCSVMPRYRHSGNTITNMLFSDGHVKSIHKGSLNWYTNIFVDGAYQTNVNGGYGDC